MSSEATPEKFVKAWENRETRDTARAIADEYIAAHPEMADRFGGLDLKQLVDEVSFYRSVGREKDRILADMWLLSNYEPQRIGGGGTVEVKRFPKQQGKK